MTTKTAIGESRVIPFFYSIRHEQYRAHDERAW